MLRIGQYLKDKKYNFAHDMAGGLVSGLYVILVAVSFSSLVFGSVSSKYLSLGISLALLSTFIYNVTIMLIKGYPFSIGSVDLVSGAILAIIIGHVARYSQPDSFLGTSLAAVILFTCSLSTILYIFEKFRLAQYMRYLPYPVVGGFIAGGCWFIFVGAIELITNGKPNLSHIFHSNQALQILVSLLVAFILTYFTKRYRKPWVLPLTFFFCILALHLILLFLNIPLKYAIAKGWLLINFQHIFIWQIVDTSIFQKIDWKLLLHQFNYIFIAMIVYSVNYFLNLNSLEMLVEERINLDLEIRKNRIGNIFCGLMSGIPASTDVAAIELNLASGARTQLSIAMIILITGLILFVSPQAITFIPRAILSGLLIYMGMEIFIKWVYRIWFKFSMVDSLTIIIILLIIATIGIVPGVLIGLIIACSVFVIYSTQLSPIKYEISGNLYRSNVIRPIRQQRDLNTKAKVINIYKLQGYLFFGASKKLMDKVADLIINYNKNKIRFIIFDFVLVNAVDSSVIFNFFRLQKMAEKDGIKLIMTCLPAAMREQFTKIGIVFHHEHGIGLFADIDHALEWCENILLTTNVIDEKKYETFANTLEIYLPNKIHQKTFFSYLERIEIPENFVLFRQGDKSDGLYFIESGEISIFYKNLDKTIRLASSGSGTIIGEIAFFLRVQRSATVKSNSSCVVYKLSDRGLKQLKKNDIEILVQFYQSVIHVLSERVVQSNYEIGLLSK